MWEEQVVAELDENLVADDVALRPGLNADLPSDIARYISADICALYEVYSYRNAAALMATVYSGQLRDIETALRAFRLTTRDISTPGGNESDIPKKFGRTLRPAGWVETRVQGDLFVRRLEYREEYLENGRVRKTMLPPRPGAVMRNYIDGHKVDYVYGRVAFDMEWNSKDQTFDRDLAALRAFHETGIVGVGVLVTRSASLNPVFDVIPQLKRDGTPELYASGPRAGLPKSVKAKYGASTTWMGKLLYRLNAGRHGGCPVLVFGITPKLIIDWPPA